MAMIQVPVDAVWVRRMAELADGPWTEEALVAAFTRYGWIGAFGPCAARKIPFRAVTWCFAAGSSPRLGPCRGPRG